MQCYLVDTGGVHLLEGVVPFGMGRDQVRHREFDELLALHLIGDALGETGTGEVGHDVADVEL